MTDSADAFIVVATFLYPASERPNFSQSHNVLLGLICYAWLAIAANVLYCRYKNKAKADGKYNQYIGCGDDRSALCSSLPVH